MVSNTASDKLNSELSNDLAVILDKFNIKLDLSSKQIAEFSKEMAQKIITYKLTMSIIVLFISILVFTLLFMYCKRKDRLKNFISFVKGLDPDPSDIAIVKQVFYSLSIVCSVGIQCYTVALIIRNTINIILCIVFPEKIILEFIANYI